MIHLGDCLTALQCLTKRHAWVTDPPANIGFMGRKWDKASAAGLWQPRYVHPSANLAELRSDNEFTEYWAERFGMMNDLTVDDGVAIVWALPRTQHLTQAALRYAGWKVPFVFDHIFGQGWNKNGGHLKPGHESWLIATKGHYELGIEACRIPRGDMSSVPNGGRMGYGGGSDGYAYAPHTNGAHPIDVGLSHCVDCAATCCQCCPIRIVNEQTSNSGMHSAGVAASRGSLNNRATIGYGSNMVPVSFRYGDTTQGSNGARFFHNFAYFAKASGRTDEQGVPGGERHAGCENLFWRANKKNPFGFDRVTREEWETVELKTSKCKSTAERHEREGRARGNVHPTVKSIALMMHLVKLAGALNPRNEPFRVGDLCVGSGSTAIACQLLGAEFDGAEMCAEAIEIANARLAFWAGTTSQALESFILTGDMPGQTAATPLQRSLFE